MKTMLLNLNVNYIISNKYLITLFDWFYNLSSSLVSKLEIKEWDILGIQKYGLSFDNYIYSIDLSLCVVYLTLICYMLIVLVLLRIIILLMGEKPENSPSSNNNNNLSLGSNVNDPGDNPGDNSGSAVASLIGLATLSRREANNNNEPRSSSEQSNTNIIGYRQFHTSYSNNSSFTPVEREVRVNLAEPYFNEKSHPFLDNVDKNIILDSKKINDLNYILLVYKQRYPEFNLDEKKLGLVYTLTWERYWLGLKKNEGTYEDQYKEINNLRDNYLRNNIEKHQWDSVKFNQVRSSMNSSELGLYCKMLDYMESKHNERRTNNKSSVN